MSSLSYKAAVCTPASDEVCLGQTQVVHIGACRAVWVPGQDLAMPHLMHNCGRCIFSLHCTLYVHLCMHMLYAGDHMSGLRDMSTRDSK